MENPDRREPLPLRNVVAATDFSNPAAAGVGWARDLAKADDATLHLVHAIAQLGASWIGEMPSAELTEELRHVALERLGEEAEALTRQGVRTRVWAEPGPASKVVRETAQEVGADLVVVATRGLGGFRHLLLGSTAERIVRHAERPVLCVHSADGSEARPVRHVLLPTDFSEDAGLAREAAVRVFRLGDGCKIHLLHVFQLPAEYDIYWARGLSALTRDVRARALAEVRRELEAAAQELGTGGVAVETEVAEGDPAQTIVSRATDLGVDVVAMGTHGHSPLERAFLGSVAHRVVQHAPCPVLTVRSPS